jgi:hypothetical protein
MGISSGSFSLSERFWTTTFFKSWKIGKSKLMVGVLLEISFFKWTGVVEFESSIVRLSQHDFLTFEKAAPLESLQQHFTEFLLIILHIMISAA